MTAETTGGNRGRLINAMIRLREAREELTAAIEANCPGPHRFVQHRDGLLPWCESCWRTATGEAPNRRTTARRTSA